MPHARIPGGPLRGPASADEHPVPTPVRSPPPTAPARPALGDLRPRRDRLARPRRLPAPALHALPGHGRLRAVGLVVALSAVLVTVLRLGISSAFFRFYFDSKDPAQRRLVLRTSFWFTMAQRNARARRRPPARGAARGPARPRRRESRPRRLRRRLGADELRAADRALPRRGALDGFRAREPGEHRRHRRRHRPARGRSGAGRARRDRRQLHRHPRRLPRPARLAPRAARAPVLAPAPPGDEPLRDPARAGRARADRDQLQRPLLPRPPGRSRRGRAVRARRAHRLGDGAAADRLPHGLAGVRVLDRGRRRGEADVRVRPDVPRRDRLVARAGARPARALAGAPARDGAVLRGRTRRRAARLRRDGLRGVHRDGDRRRTRASARSSTG